MNTFLSEGVDNPKALACPSCLDWCCECKHISREFICRGWARERPLALERRSVCIHSPWSSCVSSQGEHSHALVWCWGLPQAGLEQLPSKVQESPSLGGFKAWSCGSQGSGLVLGTAGFEVGCDDLKGLFQPNWSCGSEVWLLSRRPAASVLSLIQVSHVSQDKDCSFHTSGVLDLAKTFDHCKNRNIGGACSSFAWIWNPCLCCRHFLCSSKHSQGTWVTQCSLKHAMVSPFPEITRRKRLLVIAPEIWKTFTRLFTSCYLKKKPTLYTIFRTIEHKEKLIYFSP